MRVFVCNDYVKRSESSHRLEYRAVYISVIILLIIIYLDKPEEKLEHFHTKDMTSSTELC